MIQIEDVIPLMGDDEKLIELKDELMKCIENSEKIEISLNKEIKDFTSKLEAGLQIAEKRMLEEKALRNETIVVSNAEGKIEYLSAKDVLATY